MSLKLNKLWKMKLYTHNKFYKSVSHTSRPRKLKNKAEASKMGLRFFPMNFHVCVSFVMSQNAYNAISRYYFEQYLSFFKGHGTSENAVIKTH